MKFKLRTFVVVSTLAICFFTLTDTVDWYFVKSEDERALIRVSDRQLDAIKSRGDKKTFKKILALKKTRKKVINLGLDLQGGLYLVLGIKDDVLKKKLFENYLSEVTNSKKYKGKSVDSAILKQEAEELLKARFAADKEQAVRSAYKVIGNRINQFGISEPRIEIANNERITVSLAGVKDPQAAEDLLSRVGRLTFQLVDKTTVINFKKTFGYEKSATYNRSLFTNTSSNPRYVNWRIADDVKVPTSFKVPKGTALYQCWESDEDGIQRKAGRIFLREEILLDGRYVRSATPTHSQDNQIKIAFTLKGKGVDIFRAITRKYKGHQLAIVLDGRVMSYPNIEGVIPGGRGEISGSFTLDEAKNLAAILSAGSFNVSLRVEEKRAVGPELGRDSVRSGMLALAIGFGLVILFMFVYYKFAGLIANIALLLNVVLVLAILTMLGATLTLPGIAGLILTLGMSVDANVIVFERIKEELKGGKNQLRVAVDKGFGRAFRTILDANITTLLAALLLFQIGGSSAIQGFAVTLMIGICSSMFTALFVSRLLIDMSISAFRFKKIAI